jgi:hypothetical protein
LSDLQEERASWKRNNEKSEVHSPNVSLGDILYTSTEYEEVLDPLQTVDNLSSIEDATNSEVEVDIQKITEEDTLIAHNRPIYGESVSKQIGSLHRESSNLDKTEIMIISADAVASPNSVPKYGNNILNDSISDLMSNQTSYSMV